MMRRTKKRSKASRYRGYHTHGRGFKKKARGSGHQGGKGMAGTGKRGDAKKTMILNLYGNDYFGRDKTLRRGRPQPKPIAINFQAIQNNLSSYIKQGIAKDNKGTYDINLKGYKILAQGDLSIKATITADAASKAAIEKAQKAGGKIVLAEK